MLAEKLTLGILCGGRSGEHEVSVMSARSIYEALDRNRFTPLLIGISKQGAWYLIDNTEAVFAKGVVEEQSGLAVAIIAQPEGKRFVALNGEDVPQLDVVFPVLHGTYGEDGTIQGLLELAGIPYVGAGVMASAVGMDKVMMKRVFRQAGLPVVDDVFVTRREMNNNTVAVLDYIEQNLSYPCFVKPANMGSSVGINRADNREELEKALKEAARFDAKIIVEQGVPAREIECSVLGNHDAKCSIPGEIVPGGEFYDYEAKYRSEDSLLLIPAPLTEEQVEAVQQMALKVYEVLESSGLSRIDFFVTKDSGEIYVNEINTMPGFTTISMYPKLWEASGIPYGELITELVNLAFERYKDRAENETSM